MQCAQVLQSIHNCIKSNAYGRRLRLLLVVLPLPKMTYSPVIFPRSERGCEADLESFPGPAESLIQKKSNWFQNSTYTLKSLTSIPITSIKHCSWQPFLSLDSWWNTESEIRQTRLSVKIVLYVQEITLITDLFVTSACLLSLYPLTEISFSLSMSRTVNVLSS